MKIVFDDRLTAEEKEFIRDSIENNKIQDSVFDYEEISDVSKLDEMDISTIEKYLRMKKLEKLNKK